jgi:RimJ/RimL family protein N-acetyltransferase
MKQQPQLTSERLILRAFTSDDAPRVQVIVADKRISEMTASIPYPYPETGAIDWISTHEQRWLSRENVSFAVVLKSTNTIIGAIGLVFKESSEAELGYWFGVDYWGKGYATEAAKCINDFGLGALNFDTIKARALSRNPASRKVLLKSGFKHMSTTEGSCGDKFESLDYFEISAISRS